MDVVAYIVIGLVVVYGIYQKFVRQIFEARKQDLIKEDQQLSEKQKDIEKQMNENADKQAEKTKSEVEKYWRSN